VTAQVHSIHNPFTAEEIERGLFAMIAWAGNASAASRYLTANGLEISPATLNNWKQTHAIRYLELREHHAAQMEENLAHEFRDVARLAVEAQRAAIGAAQQRIADGDEQDPARAAANLARVAQSSTDKLLSLTGRPSQIIENRDTEAIIRSLAAKGVLKIPDEPAELEA